MKFTKRESSEAVMPAECGWQKLEFAKAGEKPAKSYAGTLIHLILMKYLHLI